MTLTRHRTFQYVGILLALAAIAAGYWYFAARAGVKTNTSGSQPQGVGDLSAGLAGYWKFDDGSGSTAIDSSTNSLDGTGSGGPSWTAGQIGGAAYFDGSARFTNSSSTSNALNFVDGESFTITAWFNRDTFTGDDTIIAKRVGISAADEGYTIYIDDATDKVTFEVSDDVDEYQLESVSTFTSANWHHVAISWNDTIGATMYIDGLAEAATSTGTFANIGNMSGGAGLAIGANSIAVSLFNGALDELRLYDRALSLDEIVSLYRLTTPTGVDTGLKGYWSFDGGALSGTTAYDRSGAGNNGTLTNGPTVTDGRVGQALNFDGTNDYVDAGSATALDDLTDRTVTAWIKQTGAGGGSTPIMGKGSGASPMYAGWSFMTDVNGSAVRNIGLRASFATTQLVVISQTNVFNYNEWTHVAMTWNGSTTASNVKIYINGVELTSYATQTNGAGAYDSDAAANLRIGTAAGWSTFPGLIDEARLQNRILTASEIKSLYDRGSPDKTNTGAGQTAGTGNLNSGLAGYWKFDDGSGSTVTDASVNGNNGTQTGGMTWTTGQVGGAGSFDGSNDQVAVTAGTGIVDAKQDVTLSAWVYFVGLNSYNGIIYKSGAGGCDEGTAKYMLEVGLGGIQIYMGGSTLASNVNPSTGQWTHIVGTNSAAGSAIYLNGTLIKSGSTLPTPSSSSTDWLFGSCNNLNGRLDEVRIYDRSLSSDEVGQLYRLTTPTSVDTSLKGYWSFSGSDLSGTTAYDRSGAGNNGTLTNGPTVKWGRVGQALDFDGANDYVTVPAVASINNLSTLTVSGWFSQASCASGYCQLVGKGYGVSTPVNGWRVATDIQGGGRKTVGFMAEFSGTNLLVESSTTFNELGWNYVAITWDGSTSASNVHIYLNGTEVTYRTQTNATGTYTSDATQPLDIGSFAGTGEALDGVIDEVRIYNRVLSASEIKSQYDAAAPDKTNTSVSTPQGTGRLDSGLSGYWKLDENTGTSAADASTNGNAGTLTNGPTWTTGQIGSAVDFDGTNDYISTASTIPNQGSVSVWVNGTMALNGARVYHAVSAGAAGNWFLLGANVFSGYNGFYFRIRGGFGTDLEIAGPQYTSNTQIQGWHHLTATWDTTKGVSLYIDGALASTSATTTSNFDSISTYIGSATASETFLGKIDEPRLYNRVLSADEVTQLYRLVAPTGVDTGLKGYWSFNGTDLSGTTAYDRSGAGNNGTLTGGPTVKWGKLGQGMQFGYEVARYVDVGLGNGLSDLTQKTACAWINPVSFGDSPSDATIFHRYDNNNGGGGWYLQLADDDTTQALYFSQDFNNTDGSWHTAAGTITLNAWQHVCVTYDLSSVSNDPTFYINGVSSSVIEYNTPIGTAVTEHATLTKLFIGNYTTDTTSSFDGAIDEARIYNRILSASEIKALYSSGK